MENAALNLASQNPANDGVGVAEEGEQQLQMTWKSNR